ncbi:hypothetical protein KIPE111705_19155 [Kibdelosporangium persicum]|uniref:Uncharacterized protein n=1 Tax=Kibdelosporangium persicum TaxID=2698649 RepID=A0ABX2FC36_9PSEU|nr:hypothetical protein [Kibdelosporangium persicum]NRN68325.1 hypothetical protein [Kibdelosporangium persicum]
MRPHDVEVGQTYRVRITQRDNPAQFITGDPGKTEADLLMLSWTLESAHEFDLTVTATGQVLGGEPAVTGVRVAETSHVSTPLPPEAAERLGLPTDVRYVVEGVLKDAVTGRIVSRPTGETMTVPVAWLRPL